MSKKLKNGNINFEMISTYMRCDQTKWVGTHNIDFEIKPIKCKILFLFSIVLQNLQLLESPELTNKFSLGFLLNVALKMPNTTI